MVRCKIYQTLLQKRFRLSNTQIWRKLETEAKNVGNTPDKIGPPKKEKTDLTIPKNLGKKLFVTWTLKLTEFPVAIQVLVRIIEALTILHVEESIDCVQNKGSTSEEKQNVKKKRLQSSSLVNMLLLNNDDRYVCISISIGGFIGINIHKYPIFGFRILEILE